MNEIVVGPYKKLVLFGGGLLLLKIVEEAISIGYVVDVITSPRQVNEDIGDEVLLGDALNNLSLNVITTKDIDSGEIKDYLSLLKGEALFLSIGAAWIFKEKFLLDVLGGSLFNLHGARLPQNRGGGGFSWQIMMGNRFGFCSLHLVDRGVDTGPIASFEEFIFPPHCKYPIDYMNFYRDKNISFLRDILTRIFNREYLFEITSQNEYLSSYWPRLSQDTGSWIDWSVRPEHLEQFICAFDDPYRGAKTTINGQTVRIKKVHVNSQDGCFHPYQKGIVFRKGPSWLCVSVEKVSLVIESVFDSKTGESCMASINVGDRFITTNEKLETNQQRVVYTPVGIKSE